MNGIICLGVIPHLNCAVLATGLQPEDPQCLGDNHTLLLVVRRGNTLKELEAFKSSRTAGCLVRNHTADGAVEDLGGGTVMEGARLFRVDDMAFMEEVVVAQLDTYKRSGYSFCA